MKKITESQIRQVVKEEINNLLNEIRLPDDGGRTYPEELQKYGEFLGQLKVGELVEVLRKLPAYHTLNQFNFIELFNDRTSRMKLLVEKPVYIFHSDLSGYKFVYYDGEGWTDLTLQPKQVTGKASHKFRTVPKDFIFQEIIKTYPEKVTKPSAKVSSDNKQLDTSGSVAGLPRNLRSLHGMTEQQLKSLIRRLIVNG